MVRPVEVHPAAVLEAQEAHRWYRERNDSAAKAFLAELDRAVELLIFRKYSDIWLDL
jgi:hypothetical protein